MAIENPPFRPFNAPASPDPQSWGQRELWWDLITEALLKLPVNDVPETVTLNVDGEADIQHGAVRIDTYNSAAADDLELIALNVPDGRVLFPCSPMSRAW